MLVDKYRSLDKWFDDNWADKVTDKFLLWFEEDFGTIDMYTDQHDYLSMMGHAFLGWQAGLDAAVQRIQTFNTSVQVNQHLGLPTAVAVLDAVANKIKDMKNVKL